MKQTLIVTLFAPKLDTQDVPKGEQHGPLVPMFLLPLLSISVLWTLTQTVGTATQTGGTREQQLGEICKESSVMMERVIEWEVPFNYRLCFQNIKWSFCKFLRSISYQTVQKWSRRSRASSVIVGCDPESFFVFLCIL